MLFLLILILSGFAAQDGLPQPSPRPLKASSIRKLEVPSLGAFGQSKCDDTSWYDHLASGSYNRTVILRTSFSGTESTLYKLPAEFADSTAFTDFSVTPDGDVTALVEDDKGHLIRFDFDSEGKISSHVQLELKEPVDGDKIAVFPNGAMLFSGHYRKSAAPDSNGKKYIGLFQPSGKLLRRLDQTGAADAKVDQPATTLPEGAATIGGDGNAYLLTPDKVLVVSASGQIQKKISFTKPDPTFSAVGVQYSEGLLAISFTKAGTPKAPENLFRYLVLNASTGEPLGLYEPTAETGNDSICFSRREGFIFLTVENDRVNLITAPLR